MIVAYVYVLFCKDKSFYCGSTYSVTRRLEEHEKGQGSKYVRSRLPFTLLRTWAFESFNQALRFEALFKSLPRKNKEKVVAMKMYEMTDKKVEEIRKMFKK
jgi:putative endonuclease